MIPKFRMWNKITSKMHSVDGLYFDSEEVQYKDEVDVLRFIKFGNTILMQSTGLFDLNGVEIFEGDIVLVLDSPYTVFYDNERGSYRLKPHDDRWNVDYMSNFSHGGNFEVVGNIYENKEQL